MANVTIAKETPDQPGVLRLLAAGDALSASLYPAESNHMLDVRALLDPAVTFFVARADGKVVGCCALLRKDGYGEIKRMFVDEVARGRGIARCLLAAVEEGARAAGLPVLKLETGTRQPEAQQLYRSSGFRDIPPFGDYAADPYSIFMEKPLRG
ncbi:MAG TPA: GNAT family N-acetyltransferase [Alphaproteobacteria bacterium]|nr:GNAT family N-acetyltransferase [Alphaproteobacteria bacterium]